MILLKVYVVALALFNLSIIDIPNIINVDETTNGSYKNIFDAAEGFPNGFKIEFVT